MDTKAAQKARATKYGIAIKDGGHVTKPGEWSNVPDEEFLDPVNYRYPCPDADQTRYAASYWGRPKDKEQYSSEERAIMDRRLAHIEKKFGIGEQQSNSAGYVLMINGDLNGVAPTEIQVIPSGRHTTPRYPDQPFLCDEQAAAEIMKNFSAQKNDMVIDYEHQTLADPPVAAPAGGWIKKLINKGAEGIWAAVEWTKKAQEMIANKEYRYVSPVFVRRIADGRVTRLLNVALTNQPNIDGMVPLINKLGLAEKSKEVQSMKKILVLLGLAETATEDEAVVAINKLIDAGKVQDAVISVNKKVIEALGLKDGAPESEITGTIMAMKQSHTQQGDLAGKVTELQNKLATRDATDAVDLAINSGKITPAQKDWALDYAKRDLAGFQVFVSKAPVVVRTEKVVKEEKGGGGDGALDETTLQVCKMMGNKPEDVKKTAAAA